MQSLLRKLARIACFKPYLPWCLRAAPFHSSALQLQAKPQLEVGVAEGRCVGCSPHCSAGTSSRAWGAGEGSLLSHGRFVFWSLPVEPTQLVHCCLQPVVCLSAQALEKGLTQVRHFPWENREGVIHAQILFAL